MNYLCIINASVIDLLLVSPDTSCTEPGEQLNLVQEGQRQQAKSAVVMHALSCVHKVYHDELPF